MRRWRHWFAALLVVAGLWALVGWVRARAEAAPRLVVAETVWDFGEIGPRAVSHSFAFRNAGSAPLRLRAESYCSCTSVLLDRQVVAPGGTATVIVSFDPVAITTWQGPFEQEVLVLTNDPVQKDFRLTIKANVVPAWGSHP